MLDDDFAALNALYEELVEALAALGKKTDKVVKEQTKTIENLEKLKAKIEKRVRTELPEVELSIDEEPEEEVAPEAPTFEEEPVVEEAAVEEEAVEEPAPEEPVVEEEPVAEEEPVVEEEFVAEPLVCSFRISHDDVRYGLQGLLNAMCDDSHFYSVVAVYDKYFYYCDYFTGDAFKQSYKVRKDVVSFNGDPEPVFTEFVTQAEKDELEKLRKDYAALVEFKANTEAAALKAEKDAVFADAKYAKVANTKAFKNLVDNAVNYSVEECAQKADEILDDFSTYAVNFAAIEEDDKPQVIGFGGAAKKKSKAYGNLFG
jgi:hypothetical protein